MSLLKTVEVIHNPNNLPVDRAVIWLHGLGANGHDFEPVVPDLGLDGNHGIRFVFPHARHSCNHQPRLCDASLV